MPRINTYSDNTSIENDDKVLTYDTQAAATKITAFSTIWNWIVSKLHALTSSSAALTPSTDRVLMDKNGTMTRVEPAAVAKYGIETYNGSTIAGSAQTVKAALDALNSKTEKVFIYSIETDAGSSNWKLESQTGYNFPSVFIFGANGTVINQTIQVLGARIETLYNGTNPDRNLNPVKISNTAFSITIYEYARLSIISRTPLTITKITS